MNSPTNSERLYRILHALTGDSEPNLWRVSAVRALVAEVRRRGLRDDEDPSATLGALTEIEQMLQLLVEVLRYLPEPLPAIQSQEALEQLRSNWRSDPCRGIETTEGFEAHQEDLLTYRLGMDLAAKRKHFDELDATMRLLATSLAPYLFPGA